MKSLFPSVPPTVQSSPMEMAVREHEDVTLTCTISGSPEPLVSWEREGASLPVMSRTRIELLESRNANTGIYMVRTVMFNYFAKAHCGGSPHHSNSEHIDTIQNFICYCASNI